MMVQKIVTFDVALKSTERQWVQKIPEVYTNDLGSVSLQFRITDCTDTELTGSTAMVLLKMRDGSFFQGPSVDVERTLNVFSYTLKENEGNHDGLAEIQLIVTIGAKEFATQKYNFKVITGLDSEVAREIMIYDWSTLTAEARAYIDQFTADEILRDAEFDNNQFDRNVAFNAAQGQRTTDFGLAQTQRNTDFGSAQTQRVNTFNAAEAARVLAFNNAETSRAAGYDADHSRAETDHTGATTDRTNAATDRTNAATDRTNAAADRTLAGTDHTRAESDHATALSDHAVLGGYDGRLTDVEVDTSFDATNIVMNGDFSNGTVGWDGVGNVFTTANNILKATGKGTVTPCAIYQDTPTVIVPGHKYYSKISARVTTSGNIPALGLSLRGTTAGNITIAAVAVPVVNTWYSLGAVFTPDSVFTGNVRLRLNGQYSDIPSTNGEVIETKNWQVLDLTAIFGAGKEPTAAEMDRILARFTNSWFDGTKNLFSGKTTIEKQIALDSGAIMDATNLVTNGDFSNGTTGWSGTMITVTNGVARLLSDNTGGVMQQYPNTAQGTVKGNGGNKYYIRALVSEFTKVGYAVGFFQLGLSTTTPPFSSAGIMTYIVTPASAFNTLYLNHTVNAGSLIDYKIDNITLIDLTSTFGAGNEPTLENMDAIMSKFENSWFDGTKNLFQAKASLNKLMELDARTEFEMRNVVSNGDFSNGATGWTPYNASFTSVNGIGTMISDGTSGAPYVEHRSAVPIIPSSKYYLRIKARVTNASCLKLRLRVTGSFAVTDLDIMAPVQNQWYESSMIALSTTQSGNVTCYLSSQYVDAPTSNGMVAEFDNVSIINLTQAFGAGKEPTLAEMDRLMARFPNSWFDGVKQIQTIETLYQEKANKVQEAWITPTLLSGWVAYDTDRTPKYMKDEMGFVHLKGAVKNGTTGVTIFVLPTGYKPLSPLYFAVMSNFASGAVGVNTGGNVIPATGSNASIYLDGITFKAEV